MTLMDLTIVNIAIPNMVDKLDVSLDRILWVVNVYSLALAVLMVTAGRLGDLRGKKELFIAGISLFTVASAVCGISQTSAELISARAVQGIGAALLLPQTLSIIVDIFPPKQRGAALGIWGTVAGVSGAAGPTIGGLLVSHLDWRWIFFVNIPLGIIALVGAVAIMPATKHRVSHRFDGVGVALSTAMLFCLTFGLIEGEPFGWDTRIWGLLIAAVVLFVVLLVHQRGQQENEPLIPFALFRDRNFSVMNIVGIAVSFGVVGLLLPLTIYLQSVREFSALKAGLTLLPLSLGTFIMAGPAGIIAGKFGGKWILMAGLTAFAGGLAWIVAVADPSAGWFAFAPPLFLIGLGAGCTFAPMASEVMRNVPARLTGAASGLNNALRQVGSVLAGAVIGAVLQSQLASSLAKQAEARAGDLPAGSRSTFVQGFKAAGKHLDVGASQGTGGGSLPTGVPAEIAHRIQEVAGQVFAAAFTDALRPAMLVPAAVLLVAVAACLLVQNPRTASANPHGLPVTEEELAAEAAAEAAPVPVGS
jgi:EmrB/QacA subfamily drug resistance transporter